MALSYLYNDNIHTLRNSLYTQLYIIVISFSVSY